MGYYTEAELADVRKLRQKRRAVELDKEAYAALCAIEEEIHRVAYRRWEGDQTSHKPPFGQPPDVSGANADAAPLPTVGPVTQAPWYKEPKPLPPIKEQPGWLKDGPMPEMPQPLSRPPERSVVRRRVAK